jgi:hypothetical protein
MKQLKLAHPEGKTGNAKSTPSTTTRQEIDTCVKDLARLIERDPKKASKVFESWLGGKAPPQRKKRAA